MRCRSDLSGSAHAGVDPHATQQYLLICGDVRGIGLVAVGGQLRITPLVRRQMGAERSLVIGATIWRPCVRPGTVIPNGQRFGVAVAVMALVLSASLLAVPRQRCFLSKCVPWSHCRATGWWRPRVLAPS